jgi:hypothetical protein
MRKEDEHVSLAAALAGTESVDLNTVINDQIAGNQWVDGRGVAAEGLHGFAHGCKVNDAGHAGEVLQNNAADHERDFLLSGLLGVVAGQAADVVGGDDRPVNAAEHGLENDADGVRQAGDGLADLGLA